MHRRSLAARMLLLSGLILGLCACAPKPIWRPDSAYFEPITAQQYQDKVQARSPKLPYGRILYRARLTHAGEVLSFRYALVFDGESQARIETLPANGAYTLSLLVIDGERAVIWDSQDKSAHEISSPRTALARTLRVPLDVADLIAVTTGRLPALLLASDAQVARRGPDLLFVSRDKRSIAVVDSQSQLMKGIQFVDAFRDSLAVEVQYAAWQQQATHDLPKLLTFRLFNDDATLELELVGANLQSKPAHSLFELQR